MNKIKQILDEIKEREFHIVPRGEYIDLLRIIELQSQALEFYKSIEFCQLVSDSCRPVPSSITINDELWNVKAREALSQTAKLLGCE